MDETLNACHGLPEKSFAAGETILAQGDETPKLAILARGEVEVVRDGLQIATTARPGAIFGEISVILRSPHSATVRAVAPATLYLVENPDSFLWERAEINFELMRVLARRLVAVTDLLVEMRKKSDSQDDAVKLIGELLEKAIHQQQQDFPSAAK